MEIKIEHSADGIVLHIPQSIAEQMSFAGDATAEAAVSGDSLVIRPAEAEEPSLEELCAKITDENRHEFIDWGPPRGKEVW